MNATTHRAARSTAALIAALAALALAAPLANAKTAPTQKSIGSHVRWYHWHASSRATHQRPAAFHSTAVIGLKRMRDLDSLRRVYGLHSVIELPRLRAAVVHIATRQLRALLSDGPADPRIRYVSTLGPKRRTMGVPDDPYISKLDGQSGLAYEWQFLAAHVDRALDFTKGDPHVVVGVIDTGVDVVPDLKGKVDSIWTVNHDGSVVQVPLDRGNDENGHGTAVTSLIVANVDDGFGLAGFGGTAHAIVIKADSQTVFYDAQLAIALDKLVAMGVRVVNMSLGGTSPSDPILVDAIHRAAAAGVLIVAAAGNQGGYVDWPAADLQPANGVRSDGIAVGATDADGSRASFSNWGLQLSLTAPGGFSGYNTACGGVLVALPPASAFDDQCDLNWWDDNGSHYAYMRGTSFASPEVAGIAALILAVRPGLKPWQVADIIKQSASRNGDGWTPSMGCGELDAGAALELAVSRTDDEWAQLAAEQSAASAGDACSTTGDAAATWPVPLADQTIRFDPIATKNPGTPDFELSAAASSGLPLSFAAEGKCTLSGAIVHVTGVGACMITASQSGDDRFNPAPSVTQTFLIVKPTLRTPAKAKTKKHVKVKRRKSHA